MNSHLAESLDRGLKKSSLEKGLTRPSWDKQKRLNRKGTFGLGAKEFIGVCHVSVEQKGGIPKSRVGVNTRCSVNRDGQLRGRRGPPG